MVSLRFHAGDRHTFWHLHFVCNTGNNVVPAAISKSAPPFPVVVNALRYTKQSV